MKVPHNLLGLMTLLILMTPTLAVAQGQDMRLETLRAQAEQGDPSAQLSLGTAYAHGTGVEQDEELAIEWLSRAAEAGNTTAQYNLGILYVALGEFVEAYYWMSIASKRSSGRRAQEKALSSKNRLILAINHVDMDLAKRDAGDWLEEFAPNPRANSAEDVKLEFIKLPWSDERPYPRSERRADFQRAARESLGMSK